MIQKCISLFKAKGVQQSMVTIFGNVGAAGLSAVALILLSRILGPEQYGVFSVAIALGLLIAKTGDLGINIALNKQLAQAQRKRTKQDLYRESTRLKMYISIALFLLGMIVSRAIAEVLSFPSVGLIFSSFLLGIITLWYEHILIVLQSLHRFTQAVTMNFIQASTKFFGTITLVAFSSTSIITGFFLFIFGPVISVAMYKKLLPSWLQFNPKTKSKKTQQKLIHLAKFSAIAYITLGVAENIDVLFAQKFLTSFETGLFAGAWRLTTGLVIVGYSLGAVLNPRVAKYKKFHDLNIYIKKAFLVMITAMCGFLFLFPFTKPLIFYTIGPAYMQSASILLMLLGSGFLYIATIPFSALFYRFEAPWFFSVSGVIQLTLIIIGNIYFVPRFGLEAIGMTRFVSQMIMFFVTVGISMTLYIQERKRHDIHGRLERLLEKVMNKR